MWFKRNGFISIVIIVLLIFGFNTAEAEDLDFDFFTLFENHGAVMLLIEAESGNIVRANKAASDFYGYSITVLETMTIQQINMLDPEEVEMERRAAAAEKRNFFIFPHRLADGTIRTVEVFSYPFQLGDKIMLYSVIHDITERVEKETLLQQKLAHLEHAEQIAKLGYWELNLGTAMFSASEEARAILGLTEEHISSSMAQGIVLPEYRSMRDVALQGLILRNEPYDIIFQIKRPADGRIAHIHSIADFNEETNTVFGIVQDITNQIEQTAVINRQRDTISFYMIVFIVILLFFIWFLVSSIKRRKETENTLKKRLKMEKMLALVSQSFVSSTAKNLPAKLEEMVAVVGEGLDTERCYITEFSSTGVSMTMTHEWCREGIEAHIQYFNNIPLNSFPWIAKQSLSSQFIFIPDVEKLSEVAFAEKEHLLNIGVKSVLALPIRIFGQNIAHLGFDLRDVNRQWSEEEVSYLQLLTNILSDAFEKCIMEKNLLNEKERIKTTISSVGDGVIATDKNGIIDFINPVAQNLTGWTENEAVGKAFKEVFKIVNEYTREPTEDPVEKVLITGKSVALANHTLLLSKDGTEIPIADSAAPIKDETGMVHGVVLVFRDVSLELDNLKKIQYLSFHDQLTGLYNRHYFQAELNRLDCLRNLPLSVVVADVNGLKLVNDAFGHKIGDELLRKAAEVLSGQCRQDEIITRIGGDEFVILLPKTSIDEVERIVKRIQTKTKEVFVDSIGLSLSLGYACKSEPNVDFTEVYKQAEKYMYKRKLHESQSMRVATVYSIIRTLFEKDKREEFHSNRVSELNAQIGRAMGFTEEKIEEIRSVGVFHDIGKIAISETILNKVGVLTPDERFEIRRHPEVGYHILNAVTGFSEVAEYVLAHHERWDGTGYPKGLRENEIPLQARITSVVNVYADVTSEKPYKKTLSKQEALEELKRNAGTQFDPDVVKVFIEWAESNEVLE